MADGKFAKALNDVVSAESEGLMEYGEEHVFSEKFERDMKRLVSRRKKPYYGMINTAGKRAACTAAVLLTAASLAVMNVEAARNAFAGFLIQVYGKFSNFVSDENDEKAPQKLEELYEITAGLDGFEKDWEALNDFRHSVTYLNGTYVIDFEQSVKSGYDTNWNTEDAEIEAIMVDGCEAVYFCDNNDYHHLIWSTEDYVFSISTNIGKDALIEMSKSVQKVE